MSLDRSPATSPTTPTIIDRGTGLIAGSPTPIGNPAFVTVPTPSPATKTMPPALACTRTIINAPWVTSGSSPASLVIPASAQPSPQSICATANVGVSPLGSLICTVSGNAPPQKRINAALVAAVAQAPVVQPRRKDDVSTLVIKPDYKNLLRCRQSAIRGRLSAFQVPPKGA